jgi:uncharacterized integral membrane protein
MSKRNLIIISALIIAAVLAFVFGVSDIDRSCTGFLRSLDQWPLLIFVLFFSVMIAVALLMIVFQAIINEGEPQKKETP